MDEPGPPHQSGSLRFEGMGSSESGTGAEWQLDKTFNLADELLRDPEMKTVFKAALEKGAEIVCRPARK